MMNAKTKKWLLTKKATPSEWSLYLAAMVYQRPFQNGDLLEKYGTSRTNIRQHLHRMIDKGMIIRHSYKSYIAVLPN